MEPLFRILVVGVVPAPTELPPAPFAAEDLQRIYLDVSRTVPYSQFGFLPADQGAQFLNPPSDRVMVQPGLVQIHTPVDSTAERAREKALTVLRVATDRLKLSQFLQGGIKVIAHVAAPPTGAKAFVADRLMGSQSDRLNELGPDFFGGGVKFRAITDNRAREDVLLIEPYVADDTFIWLDYDVKRHQPFTTLDQLGGWIDDAFDFVRRNTMTILKEAQ